MVDCAGVLKETSYIYRIQRNTTHLGLYGNKFQMLPIGGFDNITDLVSLDLSDNWLRNIESQAFVDLHKLTFLDLSDNCLDTQAVFPTAFVIITSFKYCLSLQFDQTLCK